MITKTDEICGGVARIDETRLPVWSVFSAWASGLSFTDMKKDWPALTVETYLECLNYAGEHPEEIAGDMVRNESAAAIETMAASIKRARPRSGGGVWMSIAGENRQCR